MTRVCPKCGKIFKGNRSRCNGYFPGGKRCETVTVEVVTQPAEKPWSEPWPREIEPESKPKPEKVPAFKGRAEEIMYCLREFGPLTYKELADKMDVTYKRAARLVSQMVRDGVKLKREGRPRKVSLG